MACQHCLFMFIGGLLHVTVDITQGIYLFILLAVDFLGIV